MREKTNREGYETREVKAGGRRETICGPYLATSKYVVLIIEVGNLGHAPGVRGK
jgi:hypothetical protein